MRTIPVTGGTCTVGRPTVQRLRAVGHEVRVLSRKSGPDVITGDLSTGEGLPAAVEGIDTVIHLSTSRRRGDVVQARQILESALSAGVEHLVLISIVGIDQIPMPYYRDKLAIERLVTESSIPYSILRATQFHDLVDEVLRAQRFLPFLLAPAIPLQPIAVEDVAERLAEIAESAPSGRLPDIGGPEQRSLADLARAWKRATNARRPVVPLRLPGKAFRGFAQGASLVDGPPYGRTTFHTFLTHHYTAGAKR
jgi:uncharacterized protein YbjT (DUF2867 family)